MILFLWTRLSLDGVKITFVESMSVGATLSATDPVTILAIFNTYKVDPKLYTVIFGESILNDAVAIVLFETAQKYRDTDAAQLTPFSLVESIGIFLLVFFGSLLIGLVVGMITSLLLKFTHVRRFPKTESCIILLIAYASYFFSNAISMSGRFPFLVHTFKNSIVDWLQKIYPRLDALHRCWQIYYHREGSRESDEELGEGC
jgi:sodium/hydrogen exchanger-like protein 6/7